MRIYVPTICLALDRLSGEIIDSEVEFKDRKQGFLYRTKEHEGSIELQCLSCSQRLFVSTSRRYRAFFKHGPNSGPCDLKQAKMSESEKDEYIALHKAKESPLHMELKESLAKALQVTDGVDPLSISVDDRFIVGDGQRRKPDVYCLFKGMAIAFEIQLSKLPLRYILDRQNFYRSMGIFLMWILEDFDKDSQGRMELDLKYQYPHQNFFKLAPQASGLRLSCDYKHPFIKEDVEEIHEVWKSSEVSLHQLTFDKERMLVYFLDFEKEWNTLNARIEQVRVQRLEEAADCKAEQIIAQIKKVRNSAAAGVDSYTIRSAFRSLSLEIDGTNELEIGRLNLKLGISGRQKPALIAWIEKAKEQDGEFLRFILEAERIVLDVNQTGENGQTTFGTLLENDNLDAMAILPSLFQRGYCLQKKDAEAIEKVQCWGRIILGESYL